jgi:tRNA-dihydrouridine synthase
MVQLAGAYPDAMSRTAELIKSQCQVDFIDLNLGEWAAKEGTAL